MEIYRELIEKSQSENRGLTFYVNGQEIPGLVVSVQTACIVVRNQTHDQIVIPFDKIDAVAL